ncbi:hypothetical protein K491DRAFT_360930 [Lophiostoma macrostomum CBS 122681]|uniref:Uncharacterized protein n=1 Tax=Lophiostoma macrostomum CBS 122681 TaxID=1314788 RepID=A0A6A6TE00_9PLEO|nr:hypothetical protein K491DRAFT_360930 [Lophiostoma macrostomum CBS 122681]
MRATLNSQVSTAVHTIIHSPTAATAQHCMQAYRPAAPRRTRSKRSVLQLPRPLPRHTARYTAPHLTLPFPKVIDLHQSAMLLPPRTSTLPKSIARSTYVEPQSSIRHNVTHTPRQSYHHPRSTYPALAILLN